MVAKKFGAGRPLGRDAEITPLRILPSQNGFGRASPSHEDTR